MELQRAFQSRWLQQSLQGIQSSLEVSRQSSVGTSDFALHCKDMLFYAHYILTEGVPNVELGANCLVGSKYSTPSLEHGFCLTWLLKVFVLTLSPHHQAVTTLSFVA